MNINKVVIKMQGHSKTDAGAAFGALGMGSGRGGGKERKAGEALISFSDGKKEKMQSSTLITLEGVFLHGIPPPTPRPLGFAVFVF